ncbi:MAG: phosphoglycerate kinase [Candidatus Jettenia sp.]|uniref:Phosphoglycerate kinase n=1 Tax=Candidatus Jettenia caeni TaxID=247490 RepID=I3IIT4_9BACT|nr:phosphoglycerate kinase [Candidatus Jettenia sp. AMX1]MBC6928326.1 phosphoglycerate kinase [Candidatus Jettenia sp.]GAB61629.1 phosphoglycerate kinase [Candidatus Jettenia caeni]KAA0251047.1 MAG: phosphoglycerate kinase [Candidatus Jettenia sp. AMX1]MCE7880693.1 phosphoglycerate kinase [Candidatus Jettenia sp. AMX1]MCQ3926391.1 phosphoglycerate kinase [Candidatus Jettenia sp.]
MDKLFIKELDVHKKKVMIRTDYNVPLDEEGKITDDTRIRATLPTIDFLLDEKAKVIIASHLGRPDGKVNPKYSLKPVARRLQRFLDEKVRVIMADDCIGPKVKKQIEEMNYGDVLVLENLRFHSGEEKNDPAFAGELASLCDVFIQDAFGNCHRKHASMVGIDSFIPSAAGFLLKKEIDYFEKSVNQPMRPVVALLGGAKVSDKIKIIENLSKKMDKILIGGAMAFTFLKAQGFGIGKSLVEDSMLDVVKDLMDISRKNGTKLYLPVDFVVAEKFDGRAETKVVPYQEIPERWIALDIGPATTKLFYEALQDAKTIVWNGPMGAFEIDAFSRGTYAMIDAVTSSHASTIVGGGDTDMAFHKAGKTHEVSFISTGGGAFLKLLEGSELPGVASLSSKKKA